MNMKPFSRFYQPVWHITSDVFAAIMQAVQEGRPFSMVESRVLYQTYLPTDSHSYGYAEVGVRYVMFDMPARFDSWGFDDFGGRFDYGFCVVDDFGNAVPVEPFNHYAEGYQCVLVPDYDNPPAEGEPYRYVRMNETVH